MCLSVIVCVRYSCNYNKQCAHCVRATVLSEDGEAGEFEQEGAGAGGLEVDGYAGVRLGGVDGGDTAATEFGMLDFGSDGRAGA